MDSSLSRRTFLQGCLATTGLLGRGFTEEEVKIDRIQVFPLTYPMVGRFKFFEDPQGKRIGRAAALIKITAQNGVTGWGQSVPIPRWSYETLESVTSTIRNYFTPILLGRSVFDIVGAHRVMNQAICSSFSTGMPMAKAGVDLALHDLAGKLTGQTLPQRWGRKPVKTLSLSWTLNPKKLSDLDRLLAKGWEQGYRHFNVKVAPNPKYDVELCRQVKKQVPGGFLWADANGGYDLATALSVAPKLADLGVDVLEQPLKTNRISGYRRLKRQGALPIYMDEGVVSPHDLIEFIRLDMLDGVAMKPARCGGLLSARRQIEILLDAGLGWLGSGLTDPDLSLAATLLLYGAYDYRKPAALNGPQFIPVSILTEPLMPKDGKLALPTGPGLGVTVSEKKLVPLLARDLMGKGK